MVRFTLSAALLAAAALARANLSAPQTVPGAFIVEYEEDQDTGSFINSIDDDASLRKDLRYKLFKGASIQFTNVEKSEDAAAKVLAMPKVKNVWPLRRYPLPQHTVHSTGSSVAAEMVKRQLQGNGTDTFSPHLQTQVNKFRDAGITGQGIKIGVVDTGTDYLHPALGGCFGPGCLVAYGRDIVGDNYDGSNTPVPDADPMDTCQGHGTHVAGIIAAQSNNPYGIIGAAQGVTLGSYRVFGCQGDVGNDVLIAAFNQAYEDGSDIISASIGGPSGWSDDPWATVVSRIVKNGVPCLISAGNEGDLGIFYASTAADGRGVTAIGSIDNTLSPALLNNASFTVNGAAGGSFGFTPGSPALWNGASLPLYPIGFDTTDPANGCDPYPASIPDLSGYAVLVRRGTCTFVQKVQNAVAKGAKYVVFYNNAAGTTAVSASVAGVSGVAMVTGEQGAAWVKALQAGSKVSVSLPDSGSATKFLANFENTASAGFLSTYTSWGPTFDLEVKPQFSTPGGMILSTYPRNQGSYGVLSGTSMACPLAAGIYALVMNVRGTKDPRVLENAISATAKPNFFNTGTAASTRKLLAPVPQQGGGLVQAWDAAHATTLLSVSSLALNDTNHFAAKHEFAISNTAKTAITYALGSAGAATAYTYAAEGDITPAGFPNALVANYASVAFSPSGNITIPAGQRKIITVTFTPPAGLNAKLLPVYSGYITVNGTDGAALSLPYMGVAGDMRSVTVLDKSQTHLSQSSDRTFAPVPANTTFTLAPPGHANDTIYRNRTVAPEVAVMLAMGSALVRGDVVPLSNDTSAQANTTLVLGTKTLGQINEFPVLLNPRGDFAVRWEGQLADGSYVPAGRYKVVIKALKIFGNPDKAEDYDSTETVPFTITYATLPKRRSVRTSKRGY
ncbi:peptidase S8/S53 domain-containing protein [Lasiosphaeris hirsuta]|uniref:Peptidase S8/S53 domain-containing protein n=1 Tax=Lasiosphaeris hirsuta TaxID=260670 RepID=A0AA40DQJ2_9PEZI|nr:peptidase S8/S53 domain-containing protein [Lasiosphaeris hirsuta]